MDAFLPTKRPVIFFALDQSGVGRLDIGLLRFLWELIWCLWFCEIQLESERMFPLGFVLGAVAGAAGAFFLGPQFAQNARPLAKAVLKAALGAIHEAQVRTAEVAEAAEDLVSEAKAELVAEAVASATAQTKAESTGLATKTNEANGGPAKEGSARAGAKTARRRMAVKRSRALSTTRG